MILGAASLTVTTNGAQAGVVGTLTYTGEVTVIQGNGYDGSGTQVGDAFSLAIDFFDAGIVDEIPDDDSSGSYIFGPTDLTYILTVGGNVSSGSAGFLVINDDVLDFFSGLAFTSHTVSDGPYSSSSIIFNSIYNGPGSFDIFTSDSLVDAVGDNTPADFGAFADDSVSNDLQITRGGARIRFSLDSLSYVPVPAPGAAGLLVAAGLMGLRRRR